MKPTSRDDHARAKTSGAGGIGGEGGDAVEMDRARRPLAGLIGTCFAGGLLMGVANIVPGISGGAMLLLVGVYAMFLASVADLTSLRLGRVRAWVVVGAIGAGALTAIALLAKPVLHMIVEHRWQMYSLLIGMRLGVIPQVWRLARPATPGLWGGAGVGLVLTALAAVFKYNPELLGNAGTSPAMLALGGLLAASATILPGLDGSYLLLLLGQYAPVLAAVGRLKDGLIAVDSGQMVGALGTLVPFGLGAAVGIGGVSVVMRWLLVRHPKPTYGVLLGVLAGAFVGLYPFGRFMEPALGSTVKGTVVTAQTLEGIQREDWPVQFFAPDAGLVGLCVLLVIAGYVAAVLLAKLDRDR